MPSSADSYSSLRWRGEREGGNEEWREGGTKDVRRENR